MAIKKFKTVARDHVEAAGILFMSRDTGNFLLLYRSKDVVDGSCWCGAGGKIEEGETPEEAARREIWEEIGFKSDGYECTPLYTHQSESLTFYNFFCVVDEQFFPDLNWESDGYVWAPLMNLPKPFHYGFQEILDDPEARDMLDMAIENAGKSESAGLHEDLADADEMPNNDYSAIPKTDELVKSRSDIAGPGDIDEGDVPYARNPETNKVERVQANIQRLIQLEVDRRMGMVTARVPST